MALADFTYRLKPQSGDTTPHDEKGTAGDLTGGTITLVDLGTSDYAWQFTGGQASAAGPSSTRNWGTAGTGITIAVRMAVTSYDASSFVYLLGYGTDATPGKGLVVGQNGANNLRFRYVDSAADTIAAGTIGTSVRTFVIRSAANVSGSTDRTVFWADGLTGSGDLPDGSAAGAVYTTSGDQTLDTIFAGTSGSTIRVADFVIWNEELSDADCHTLAESGIRATLDVGGGGGQAPRSMHVFNMMRG